MDRRLTVSIEETDNVSYVRLSGFIDEENSLARVSDEIHRKVAVINTAGVKRINSCGVRDWVNWVEQMDRLGIQFYLIECSPSVMTQVNTMQNFLGSGSIVSFYNPYYCTFCNDERQHLLDIDEFLGRTPATAPGRRCEICDHLMEFAESEDFYFSFLAWMTPRPVTEELERVIRRFSRANSGSAGSDPLDLASAPTKDMEYCVIPSREGTPNGAKTPSSGSNPWSITQPSYSSSKRSLQDIFKNPIGTPSRSPPPKGVTVSRSIIVLIVSLLLVTIGIMIVAVLKKS